MTEVIEKGTDENISEPVVNIQEFYVVSKKKFILLFAFTFGFYTLYWFYKNWQIHKNVNDLSIWPVPRAFFYIFFTHDLFRRISKKLYGARSYDAGSLNSYATTVVILTLITRVVDRFSSDEHTLKISLSIQICLLAIIGACLWQAQSAINRISGDPEGGTNNRISELNILFLCLGGLFWLLVVAGMFLG